MVPIAGGPGAGKSTLAAAVAARVNAAAGEEVAIVIPMAQRPPPPGRPISGFSIDRPL